MSEQTRAAVLIAGIAAPALAAALTWGAVLPPAKAAIEAPEQASTSDEGHAESQASEQAPESTLQRMTEAQRVVEYEGTLVYLHGAQLSTLRIAHRIDNGRSKESLFALSGPIRAVARNDRGVTCMLSGEHSFSVPRGQQGGGLLRAAPREFERIRQHYLLHALGQSRVAGRDTDVVGIVPLDHYRYGYRFFVDRATGLPLKIDLMGDTAEPIEQVMFTSVDIIGTNTDVEAETPVEPQASPLADSATILAPHPAGWRLTAMPPGFEVVARTGQAGDAEGTGKPSRLVAESLDEAVSTGELRQRSRDQAGRERGAVEASMLEHLVVSDGIATVSVYLESDAGGGLDGAVRMGAMTAVGSRVGDRHATIVGEVPERTARMLLEGLVPPPGQPGH